ncbi:MAG: biotin-dependent carboxyltransferase family protein [Rhodocyclales bacterium]|nr:biotin-dependent carboxyltransferase family protein [Rhodocyclales bacterium]
MIEILDCPLPVTIQDLGRPGYRHLGVPLSGALDPEFLAIANALAGNSPNTAALEISLLGPRLRAKAPLTIALAGEFSARIEACDGQSHSVGNWCTHALAADEVLVTGSVRGGVGYLAVRGGFDLPLVLGSRSTYARAGLGGIDGRAPGKGDCLGIVRNGSPSGPTPAPASLRLPQVPVRSGGPFRIIPGPQREYFTDTAWACLLGEGFTVSREADRMGLRLDGPRLEHDPAHGADIVSDAVTPGVIQVPGDGRPIILLADCQTVGGYPKIATVISADLPRLGHALPGETLHFVEVSMAQALAARRLAASELAECIASIVQNSTGVDLDALYGANLIDGVIDARQAN